ncbi:hypothetical protein L218DRAFT_1003584 [Marasmius fiardii PR-910]|nr:hypothetical protein L218DRAFT_1003584 [Marasmius fiardii PR-910]
MAWLKGFNIQWLALCHCSSRSRGLRGAEPNGDTSGIDIYTDTDSDGPPQCAEACRRFFYQNDDYSGCDVGVARHYDLSLWITDGHDGGSGGDWDQRIETGLFFGAMKDDSNPYLLHEMMVKDAHRTAHNS